MTTALRVVLIGALAVLASASAAGARPSIALTASPARLTLQGSGTASVRVTNSGSRAVVVDVRRAGFALDLRGRPKIVPGNRASARSWIRSRPASFALRAGSTATLAVTAKLPPHAEPGDHEALVLLTTRPHGTGAVAFRMRLGVLIDVRAPGRIVHALSLRRLRVRRSGRVRALELLVANRGNVTEEVGRDRVSLALTHVGRPVGRLRPEPRELLPRTQGLVVFRYRGRLRGVFSATVTLRREEGRRVSRKYHVRL